MPRKKNTAGSKWGAGRVAFLDQRTDIELEVARGVPVKDIYEKNDVVRKAMSYSNFTRYVRRYVVDETASTTRRSVSNVEAKPASVGVRPGPAASAQGSDASDAPAAGQPATGGLRSFVHTVKPDKSKLI